MKLLEAQASEPHRYTLHFVGSGCVSQVFKVENWRDAPREVRLIPGQKLAITFIDEATAKPVDNTHCYTMPEEKFTSQTWPSGRTDKAGRVDFDTLEAIEYSLRCSQFIVKSVKVEEGDKDGAWLHSDGNQDTDQWIRFRGGKATRITIAGRKR